MVEEKKIVKESSRAYGYNYASLADIVNQGFGLPIMETRNIDGQTFMGWLDEPIIDSANGKVIKEATWHQGAPLIVPEMKGMNAAQAMGSALTYARRYTAQMALGLACDDDAKLEKTKGAPEATGKVYGSGTKLDFNEVKARLTEIESVEVLEKYWASLHLTPKQQDVLKASFSKRKEELKEEHGVER